MNKKTCKEMHETGEIKKYYGALVQFKITSLDGKLLRRSVGRLLRWVKRNHHTHFSDHHQALIKGAGEIYLASWSEVKLLPDCPTNRWVALMLK